jgi:RNA 3'-terminal phosphate cyclase (ATP)
LLKIDGSFGEGGGQILRSTISLSVLLQKPVEIYNIRLNRPKSGLRAQHIHTIKILADIFNAKIENLGLGSQFLRFIPNTADKYCEDNNSKAIKVDIGTAGSISMVLQALIPSIALSKKFIDIQIIGGTDVRMSPTIDYLRYVVSEAYKIIGINFTIDVLRRGYYPKGGGIVNAKIFPCKNLDLIDLIDNKRIDPKIIGICSNLPRHVLDRQISSAILTLERNELICNSCVASIENAISPGTSILVYSKSDFGPYIGGDSIGEINKSAEYVGKEAATKFLKNYNKKVCIDQYLADMLVIPASLANGRSRYLIGEVTEHLRTNLYVVSKIVGCKYSIVSHGENYIVNIEGNPCLNN